MAVGASLLFAVLVYPALALAERWDGYSDLLTERADGEVKKSLILAFGMYALMIAVGWAGLGSPGWSWRRSTLGGSGTPRRPWSGRNSADISLRAAPSRVAMCISGVAMALITLMSTNTEKGNVVPGLVIAGLGVIVNVWFWLRYRRLNKKTPNPILAVQARLYRAKTLVDAVVSAALTTILVVPNAPAAYFMDKAGSLFVAGYLVVNGVIAARGTPEDQVRNVSAHQ